MWYISSFLLLYIPKLYAIIKLPRNIMNWSWLSTSIIPILWCFILFIWTLYEISINRFMLGNTARYHWRFRFVRCSSYGYSEIAVKITHYENYIPDFILYHAPRRKTFDLWFGRECIGNLRPRVGLQWFNVSPSFRIGRSIMPLCNEHYLPIVWYSIIDKFHHPARSDIRIYVMYGIVNTKHHIYTKSPLGDRKSQNKTFA